MIPFWLPFELTPILGVTSLLATALLWLTGAGAHF